MDPVFIHADESHADIVIGLMREFYVIEKLNFKESAARKVLRQIFNKRSNGLIHLIKLHGEIVGYFVLTFGFSLEFHGRDALVDELYVREKYRGKGIGKASLRFIEEICCREKIEALHLEVDRNNKRAQKLYRETGFKDHDRYLLTKWLCNK